MTFLSILQVICIGFVWKYKNTWQIPWTKVLNSQELFSTRTVESQAVYGGDGSHEMTSQLSLGLVIIGSSNINQNNERSLS